MTDRQSLPDLLLTNANVVTLCDNLPSAEYVAIQGDRIVSVGLDRDIPPMWSRKATIIDCRGRTLIPGLIDAHCHLLAYASSLTAVDCSPSAVSSIKGIKSSLQEEANKTLMGTWIRGSGYSEFDLSEKRHPSRWELDEAVPNHPVRLNHRSGHACVLNSAALERMGISMDTDEPPGGVIDRDLGTGAPTGLLMEMEDFLRDRIPPLTQQMLREGVQAASQRFLSYGVTSIQDASPHNSPGSWETLRRIRDESTFKPRVSMMAGVEFLSEFQEENLKFGYGDENLNLGHAKVMLTRTSGTLFPSKEQLDIIVSEAHKAGFPVAIHAVESEAVEAVVDTLSKYSDPKLRDRIEHCSECPPHLVKRLAQCGASVVTQPGFLYFSGRRYLHEVREDRQPWLYPFNSLLLEGINVAGSSDAPVAKPNPFVGMYAAVNRLASTGESVGVSERVSVERALRMYTTNAAYVASQDKEKGSIEPGKLADLTLLDGNPLSTPASNLMDMRALMTVIGGEIVWQA